MNKIIYFIGIFILITSCTKNTPDESLSNFKKVLEKELEDKRFYLIASYQVNTVRYKESYNLYEVFRDQISIIRENIDLYVFYSDPIILDTLKLQLDSLSKITQNNYQSLVDSHESFEGWIKQELQDVETIFKPIYEKIDFCNSIKDMQEIDIMLYFLEFNVIDFMTEEPRAGLFKFSNISGPIMKDKGDSVCFYFTAIDTTQTNYIAIGKFEPIKKDYGIFYKPLEKCEKVYTNDFQVCVEKSCIKNKDLMYYTVGPAGDTLQRLIRIGTVANTNKPR